MFKQLLKVNSLRNFFTVADAALQSAAKRPRMTTTKAESSPAMKDAFSKYADYLNALVSFLPSLIWSVHFINGSDFRKILRVKKKKVFFSWRVFQQNITIRNTFGQLGLPRVRTAFCNPNIIQTAEKPFPFLIFDFFLHTWHTSNGHWYIEKW